PMGRWVSETSWPSSERLLQPVGVHQGGSATVDRSSFGAQVVLGCQSPRECESTARRSSLLGISNSSHTSHRIEFSRSGETHYHRGQSACSVQQTVLQFLAIRFW